jgi:hypothetical protein
MDVKQATEILWPVEDWQADVAHNVTQMSYNDWLAAKRAGMALGIKDAAGIYTPRFCCPRCAKSDKLYVTQNIEARIVDHGIDHVETEVEDDTREWGPDSPAYCTHCDWAGEVSECDREDCSPIPQPGARAGEYNEDDVVRISRASDFEWKVNEEAIGDDEYRDGVPVQDTGGAPVSLYSTMQIGSASFHVHAHLAEWFADGMYFKVEPAPEPSLLFTVGRSDERTRQLWEAFGMDGACETVTIEGIGKGREYAIFVEPFSR